MSKEHIINMPLKPEIKTLLEKQADANGRATGREAGEEYLSMIAGWRGACGGIRRA